MADGAETESEGSSYLASRGREGTALNAKGREHFWLSSRNRRCGLSNE